TRRNTGADIWRAGDQNGKSFALGLKTSILQAELFAINSCTWESRESRGKRILILTDSLAAAKNINSYRIKSKLVWDCIFSLREIAAQNQVAAFYGLCFVSFK